MRVGPTPVKAICDGEMSFLFDTGYILSHACAETVYQQKNTGGSWEIVTRDMDSVGKQS